MRLQMSVFGVLDPPWEHFTPVTTITPLVTLLVWSHEVDLVRDGLPTDLSHMIFLIDWNHHKIKPQIFEIYPPPPFPSQKEWRFRIEIREQLVFYVALIIKKIFLLSEMHNLFSMLSQVQRIICYIVTNT